MNNYYKTVNKYLSGSQLHFTISDEDVSGSLTTQIAERDIYYTDLLKNHLSLTKARGICKEIHKWIFFWLIIVACAFGILYIQRIFKRILGADEINVIIDGIPIIVTALVSLVSTIIIVPVTIAKFLFNTKEDDNITSLIQHTQDHDTSGINLFKERLLRKRGKSKMDTIDSDE